MSMNRNDALKQLAAGLRKFEGFTAGQVLAAQWAGLAGLSAKDIAYFRTHADKPAAEVASACQGRSMSRTADPLE